MIQILSGKPKTFSFTNKVWLWEGGEAAWHFVSLPQELADEIDYLYSDKKHGFGSLKVEVTIGKTTWKTSIFPDKKSGTYLLPLKAEVRKKEDLKKGDQIDISIQIFG